MPVQILQNLYCQNWTLFGILRNSLDNGARYKEIVSLNNLHSSIIYPGQVLKFRNNIIVERASCCIYRTLFLYLGKQRHRICFPTIFIFNGYDYSEILHNSSFTPSSIDIRDKGSIEALVRMTITRYNSIFLQSVYSFFLSKTLVLSFVGPITGHTI